MADDPSAANRNVEIWKIKKLIKSLEAACSNSTSMISLIIPPKDQISRVAKMLADEFGTASNIRSDQISRSVVSDSPRPHESQHARPPCPSPTPGVHSNSCPQSW
uniref:Eukaryotic peptide chain release factor subunit 1 n=1 Tax=Moschus moschiferus TaxID=68415 RepID=A0A8C6FHA4_MOSMO